VYGLLEPGPPLVGCVVRGRDFSFDALKATKQCVLNIPTADLAAKVVACGNTSGRRVDKFKAFGLTAIPGTLVDAPLIAECYANLEMPRRRYAAGESLQFLRVGGAESLDRPGLQGATHAPSSGTGCFRRGRRDDQAAVEDEIAVAGYKPRIHTGRSLAVSGAAMAARISASRRGFSAPSVPFSTRRLETWSLRNTVRFSSSAAMKVSISVNSSR
jgi:hypothetical protein